MPRLDIELVNRGLVSTRSQAANLIKLGYVVVGGKKELRASCAVNASTDIELTKPKVYVSRGADKLAAAARRFKISFNGKVVLDVGSSTGGFTQYAINSGAKHVYAVDVGTNQLHPKLRGNPKIIAMEKTDIRDVKKLPIQADIALVDVSFISLLKVLDATAKLLKPSGKIVALLKPQFETGAENLNKGIVKNDYIRRQIIKKTEQKLKKDFRILAKADSELTGAKGNSERFYLLGHPR